MATSAKRKERRARERRQKQLRNAAIVSGVISALLSLWFDAIGHVLPCIWLAFVCAVTFGLGLLFSYLSQDDVVRSTQKKSIAWGVFGVSCLIALTTAVMMTRTALAAAKAEKLANEETNRRGVLVPGTGANPKFDWDTKFMGEIPENAMYVCMGNSIAWSAGERLVALAEEGEKGQPDEELITITRQPDGIMIQTRIFDETGSGACLIEDNQFTGGSDPVFSMKRPTPQSLIVLNRKMKPMLEFEFVNNHTIRILGDFYTPRGIRLRINEKQQWFGGMNLSNNVSGMQPPTAVYRLTHTVPLPSPP